MPILSDADLQGFADLVTDLLMKDSGIIRRNSNNFSPSRGSPDNWIDVAEGPCALLEYGTTAPVQQFQAMQFTSVNHKELLLPLGSDIKVDDEVEIKTVVYRVLALYGLSSYSVFTGSVVMDRSFL